MRSKAIATHQIAVPEITRKDAAEHRARDASRLLTTDDDGGPRCLSTPAIESKECDVAQPIQLTNFPALSVEDNVSLTRSPTEDRDHLTLTLAAGPGVTWWKALEVRAGDGSFIAGVETSGTDAGPKRLEVPVSGLRAARLVLSKAKLFGVHTAMYELRDLPAQAGSRLDFLWNADTDSAGSFFGFFRDVGNVIQDAADTIANVVEGVIEAVVEVATTVVEFVSSTVANVLNWVAGGLEAIPLVGAVLGGAVRWASSVVSAFLELDAALLKGGRDLLGNMIGGAIRIAGGAVGGLLARDARVLDKGVQGILSAVLGTVVGIVGKGVALAQAVLFMQMGDRRLTGPEIVFLERVYRGSIGLRNIRVTDGFAGVFSTNRRAFTLGNRIYMKNTPPERTLEVLVHECCHVWQYQHRGMRYIGDALFGQIGSNRYEWVSELASGHLRWQEFNAEAQAQFVQDVHLFGTDSGGGAGTFFDKDPISSTAMFGYRGVDYTDLALETMAHIRSAWWGIPRP